MRKEKLISVIILLILLISYSSSTGINGQNGTIVAIGHVKAGDFASSCPIDIANDGEILAVAMKDDSDDIRLSIIDMEEFRLINSTNPDVEGQWSMNIDLNPNGSRIAIVDFSYFRIYTLPELELEIELSDSTGELIFPRDVSWSPDGRFLAVGLNAIGQEIPTVTIYDTTNWTRVEELNISSNDVLALEWSFDGTMLACAGDGTTDGIEWLDVWSTSDWTKITSSSLDGLQVNDIAFNPTGSQLVVGGYEGQIQIWNTSDWSYRSFGEDDSNVSRKVSFSRDGDLILIDSVIWVSDDLERWGEIPTAIHGMFSPGSDETVTVTFDGDLYKYDSSGWSEAAAQGESPDFDELNSQTDSYCTIINIVLALVVISVLINVIIIAIIRKKKSK